jgi:hypothetical protein
LTTLFGHSVLPLRLSALFDESVAPLFLTIPFAPLFFEAAFNRLKAAIEADPTFFEGLVERYQHQ